MFTYKQPKSQPTPDHIVDFGESTSTGHVTVAPDRMLEVNVDADGTTVLLRMNRSMARVLQGVLRRHFEKTGEV